jgi:uncharacterized protein
VPQGSRADAVAAPTVLMVCNWPVQSERYARVARFVDALFDKIEQLHSPRHPKWRDTVICTNVPGLQRFQPAQDWLNVRTGAAPAPAPTPVRAEEFRSFPAQRNGGANVSDAQAAKALCRFPALARRTEITRPYFADVVGAMRSSRRELPLTSR